MAREASIRPFGRPLWLVLPLVLLLGHAARAQDTNPSSGSPADWPDPIHDTKTFYKVLLEQLEVRALGEEDALAWILSSWFGSDYHRLWLESEGEWGLGTGEVELEALDLSYGRAVSPFWDLQVGLGYQRSWREGPGPDPDRVYAVVGLQGLAPQWFEVELNLRVSQEGDVSAALEAEYDLRLTQRLKLQPRLESLVAVQAVEAFGVGAGLNDLRLGARLRYEIRRELAPYVGLTWRTRFGEAADLAREAGLGASDLQWVAGLRLWW